jgi:hypothetical protein
MFGNYLDRKKELNELYNYMQLDLERVPTNETKQNRKAPKTFSEQVFIRMRDNGNKCYLIKGEEISYKATYVKYMMQVVNEIKGSITRDLFDSIQIEVKEDASYKS